MANSTVPYINSPATTKFYNFDPYKEKGSITDAKTNDYALYKIENDGIKQLSNDDVSKIKAQRVLDNCFLGFSTVVLVVMFVAISFLATANPGVALIAAATILVGGLLLIAYTNYVGRPEFITKKNLEDWVKQPDFSNVLYDNYNEQTVETLNQADVLTGENYEKAVSFFEKKANAECSLSTQLQSLKQSCDKEEATCKRFIEQIAKELAFSNNVEAEVTE